MRFFAGSFFQEIGWCLLGHGGGEAGRISKNLRFNHQRFAIPFPGALAGIRIERREVFLPLVPHPVEPAGRLWAGRQDKVVAGAGEAHIKQAGFFLQRLLAGMLVSRAIFQAFLQ